MSSDQPSATNCSPLETMIAYSGEATGPETKFDLALFRQLNREFEADPVVPAPRPHTVDYRREVGRRRYQMLERKIGIAGKRVLELGCGASTMARVLAEEAGCETIGVDISAYDEWDTPFKGDLQLLAHDVTASDNSVLGLFDRVVSFAVLEHVVHPHAALKAVYDMLKPSGKAYIYANLYRGAKASHRYREVFFPWPHLLFENSVWREFYTDLKGEPLEPAWVNKLTYDQYVNIMGRIGFKVLDHFPSAPYFNELFYNRFEFQLAAYPKFDLMHDFIHLVVEKPKEASNAPRKNNGVSQHSIFAYPPQRGENIESYGSRFWKRAGQDEPNWSQYEKRWYESRTDGASSIVDAQPWVTFPAIDYLDRRISKSDRVFEWGSGGSTLFFQKRASEVISIEHDPGWFEKVGQLLENESNEPTVSTSYRLIKPAEGNAEWPYASGSPGQEPKNFEAYVRAIDSFEDMSFGLVIVDGRARMGCLSAAIAKVAPGGVLMLDNANYPRYQEQLEALRSRELRYWNEINLAGPGPYSRTPCWETIAWERPPSVSLVRAALAEQPLRPYDLISYIPAQTSADCADRALAGEPFELFDLTFQFGDDFDWEAESETRSKPLFLHSWHPFEPLFLRYSDTGDRAVLTFLCAKLARWIERYRDQPLRRRAPDPDQDPAAEKLSFLAADTAIGNRFYRLAYLVAAAAPVRSVTDEDFTKLLNSLIDHANGLSLKENFSPQHNHGMYQALAQLSGSSRFLSLKAEGGADLSGIGMEEAFDQGKRRLLSVLENHITSEGIHKEHSLAYHIVMANALDWVVSNHVVVDEKIAAIRDKMKNAGSWMYDGAGRLANLGDSDLEPDLPNASSYTLAAPKLGFEQALFREGGYWFVKGEGEHGRSYLAQTACFHSRAHKQADTGAFLWRDRGREILIDSGRYGYVGRTKVGSELFNDGFWYSDPRRVYVESTRAHNTVEVDSRNHPRFRAEPFGSSLQANVEKDGVFVCESTVPSLPRMSHFRILALKPGSWLLCVDTVRAADGKDHDIRQNFHIHPDWSLKQQDERSVEFQSEDRAQLYVSPLFESMEIADIARGRGDPERDDARELFGWWSSRHMHLRPCNAIAIKTSSNHATIATLFTFAPAEIDRDFTGFNVTRRRLRFGWTSDGVRETLVIDRTQDQKGQHLLTIA